MHVRPFVSGRNSCQQQVGAGNISALLILIGDRRGAMVQCGMVYSTVYGWTGLNWSPGQEHCVVFLARTLYSLFLSAKVYKSLLANY